MVATPVQNFYQAIVAPAATTITQSSVISADSKSTGPKFSDMLSASTDRAARRDASNDRAERASTHTAQPAKTTQDKNVRTSDTKETDNDDVLSHLDDTITPKDASDLLANFDVISEQLTADGVDATAQTQIKTQLQGIVDSGNPESVADILASLLPATSINSSTQAQATTGSATTDVATNLEATPTPIIGSLLSILRKSTKSEPTDKDETADAAQATTTPPIPANLLASALITAQAGFTATTDTTATPAPDANAITAINVDANASAKTITTIIPLSAEFTVATDDTKATTATSAATDAVTETPQAPDLDTLIPPLHLPENQKPLPSVTLPNVATPAADAKAALTTPSTATSQTLLNPALVDGQVVKAVKENESPATNTNNVDAINSINITPGLTGTITTNAVAPVSSVTAGGAINHAPVAEQVSVAITRASADGIDHITIQLSPDGMGRVEVKMHVAQDGQTQLQFTADKPETFDALSRDARSLERSLQESGIKADTGSMQFNLRQQPQPHTDLGGNGQFKQSANTPQNDNSATTNTTTTPVAANTRTYNLNIREGVDIHA